MSEGVPTLSDDAKARMQKEVPGGPGDRILKVRKEQLAMARERLRNLDPKSPDFRMKSEVLTNLIKRYEQE